MRHVGSMFVVMSGAMEIEIGDGTEHHSAPGDVLIAEDLTGKGHITRGVGEDPPGLPGRAAGGIAIDCLQSFPQGARHGAPIHHAAAPAVGAASSGGDPMWVPA